MDASSKINPGEESPARHPVILHVDMDAFFTSVEQRDRPELRGKPVVVGAQPNERGVVAAASYEARVFGIHSAMPSSEAGRRCPHAVFLPPDGHRYEQASEQVMSILRRFTPLVEQVSIDEAFLDVTGARRLFGSGPDIARLIKDAIHGETGLTASVGVGPNKFLAKVASDMHKPDGLTVVPDSREGILAFLAPLPVGRIWGVGAVTGRLLEREGIRKIGDLQNLAEARVARIVGGHSARHLLRLALGEDARELELDHEEKSISREHTFGRDCAVKEALHAMLSDLADDVGRRLRAAGKHALLARLKVRWQGFETVTRQRPLERPTADDVTLRAVAHEMLDAVELIKPVRLIGFGVSRLSEHPAEQLELFGSDTRTRERRDRLSRATDLIRQRHGDQSLRRLT